MRRRKLLAIAALALFALCAVGMFLVLRYGGQRTFILDVGGEEGREVAGVVSVDGVTQHMRGTLPAKFEYRGRRIAFAVALVDAKPGEAISVSLCVEGEGCNGVKLVVGARGEYDPPPSLYGEVMGWSWGVTEMSAEEAGRLAQ